MIKTSRKKRKLFNRANKNNYHIWENGRLLAIIILGFSIIFFILSLIELPFFAVFPGYTFGFLFGFYSYIFYIFVIYYAICKLFNLKIYLVKMVSKKIRVFHYSWTNMFILTLGSIILGETIFYIFSNGEAFPGTSAWNVNFNLWWNNFTSYNDWLKPNINTSGIIVNFISSVFFSIGGVIISFIASVLLISYFFFYLFFSSPLQMINNKKVKQEEKIKEKRQHSTKIIDLSFEDENKIIVSSFGRKIVDNKHNLVNIENKKDENKIISIESNKKSVGELMVDDNSIIATENITLDDTIPFDNPFSDEDKFITSGNVTEEIKIKPKDKKEISNTEFIFNNQITEESKIPNTYRETQNFKMEHEETKKKKRK
ncbi:MAG: biotin transporter BioY [Mycoplasmataceae bacterium]|nr:biotin transporter BioY [Mycoplasmataceae bacterium]